MSKELETLVELKRFIHEFDLGNVDKLFVDGSCNILERALNVLDMFRSALTMETLPFPTTPTKTITHDDGSVSVEMERTYNFVRHELDMECKKELTKWLMENIDKDIVRKWLEE